MKYMVYACGGKDDGKLVATTDSYHKAVKAARAAEGAYELGCYILDSDGKMVEW